MVKVTRKYSQGLLWIKQPDFPTEPGPVLYSPAMPVYVLFLNGRWHDPVQWHSSERAVISLPWKRGSRLKVLKKSQGSHYCFTTCLPHHNQYTHIYQMSRIHFHSICPFPLCLGPILSKEKMVLWFYLPQHHGFPTNTVEGILLITGYSSFTIEVRQLYFHHL